MTMTWKLTESEHKQPCSDAVINGCVIRCTVC